MNYLKTKFSIALLLLAIIIGAQNCSNISLDPLSQNLQSTGSLFGPLKPVLAVRNTACIMCHAQIHGDIVTDFGFGSPYFMGTDKSVNHPQQASYYSPFASKHFSWMDALWKNSSIMGDVYVPDQTIGDARLLASYNDPIAGNAKPLSSLRILDFLNGKFLNPWINNGATPVSIIERTNSTDISVPGLRGNFLSRKEIWIDSPSEDEMRSLQQAPGAVQIFAKLGIIVYKASARDSADGFIVKQSSLNRHLFLTNTDIVHCRGDIIIDGVVLLNNLNLDTDSKGCRLHVTGSVFIQGPINYTKGEGSGSNLQISSSRAIIMGMKTLSTRLTQDATTAMVSGMRSTWTDDQELAQNIKIIEDRDSVDGLTNDAGPFRVMKDKTGNIVAVQDDFDTKEWLPAPGQTSIPDASTCGDPIVAPCSIDWAKSYQRKTIDFKHLLLNAPKVYSRYYGNFYGVVIAEDALFAIDHFVFYSDPLMYETTLLPLIQDRIFHISAD